MKEWCVLKRIGQTVLNVSKSNTHHVQLNSLEADLVGKVGSEEMQSGLRGREALPSLRLAEGGVMANTSQVGAASGFHKSLRLYKG